MNKKAFLLALLLVAPAMAKTVGGTNSLSAVVSAAFVLLIAFLPLFLGLVAVAGNLVSSKPLEQKERNQRRIIRMTIIVQVLWLILILFLNLVWSSVVYQ